MPRGEIRRHEHICRSFSFNTALASNVFLAMALWSTFMATALALKPKAALAALALVLYRRRPWPWT